MYDTLPLVEFEYPNSETNHQQVRFVRVIAKDKNYLTGYELTHEHATDSGKYKKYCLSRIVRKGIHLLSFVAPDDNSLGK